MIVGEEWIEPYDGNDDPSSKRDFASLADTRIIDDWPVAPQLTVVYTTVPEPGCGVLLISTLAAALLWRRRRKG